MHRERNRVMKAHQLDADGVIINTIVVDGLDVLPDLVDAGIGGSIGDSIIDGVVVPKAPDPIVVPEKIDRLQARLALLCASKWSLIQPAIDALEEPDRSIAQAYFEDAKHWYRHDQIVLMLAPAIG